MSTKKKSVMSKFGKKFEKKIDEKVIMAVRKFDEKDKMLKKIGSTFQIEEFITTIKFNPIGEINIKFTRRDKRRG